MQELWQLTKLIRSKNAGPFELTFDIMFKDFDGFERVLDSDVLCAENIAQLYKIEISQVRFFRIDNLLAIKITIPRHIFSGDIEDTDIYGGQFHGPLVRLQIEVGPNPGKQRGYVSD
ncbi:MAG: hypothetical protein JWO91_3930 [Acidobacteriaceae bacterium]|jgi:hypothetical protein|nr:hypothetical protein [Acidobacteriaceae bacterium]